MEPGTKVRAPRSRAVGLGLLGLVLAVVLTACQPMALPEPDTGPWLDTGLYQPSVYPLPIDPANRPTVPADATNGQLDAIYLRSAAPNCVVHRDAAPALAAMLQDAAASGVTLIANSCYRDYAGQVAARDMWCQRGQCNMAAVPGTSNHGWGKAVDLVGSGTMTFASPAYAWLVQNAWQYGFNHPGWAEPNGSSPEPWHWEWVGDGGTLHPGITIGPQRPKFWGG